MPGVLSACSLMAYFYRGNCRTVSIARVRCGVYCSHLDEFLIVRSQRSDDDECSIVSHPQGLRAIGWAMMALLTVASMKYDDEILLSDHMIRTGH